MHLVVETTVVNFTPPKMFAAAEYLFGNPMRKLLQMKLKVNRRHSKHNHLN